jgi:hypothetical protein
MMLTKMRQKGAAGGVQTFFNTQAMQPCFGAAFGDPPIKRGFILRRQTIIEHAGSAVNFGDYLLDPIRQRQHSPLP